MSRVIKAGGGLKPASIAGWLNLTAVAPAAAPIAYTGPVGASAAAALGALGEAERASAFQEGLRQGLEEGHRAGRDDGYKAGYEAGVEAARAALAEEAEGLRREALSLRAALREEAEGDIVRLAMAAARKVLGRELAQHPEEVVRVVAGLLREARDQEEIEVLVHPGDAVTLEGLGEEALRGGAMAGKVRVVSDPSVEPGGAVVRTPGGTWDAQPSSQMKAVEAALGGVLRVDHGR